LIMQNLFMRECYGRCLRPSGKFDRIHWFWCISQSSCFAHVSGASKHWQSLRPESSSFVLRHSLNFFMACFWHLPLTNFLGLPRTTEWLYAGNVQKLVLVISSLETKEVSLLLYASFADHWAGKDQFISSSLVAIRIHVARFCMRFVYSILFCVACAKRYIPSLSKFSTVGSRKMELRHRNWEKRCGKPCCGENALHPHGVRVMSFVPHCVSGTLQWLCFSFSSLVVWCWFNPFP
jgi:hypothetical protein